MWQRMPEGRGEVVECEIGRPRARTGVKYTVDKTAVSVRLRRTRIARETASLAAVVYSPVLYPVKQQNE